VALLETQALTGVGIEALERALLEHRGRIEDDGTLVERRRRSLRGEVLALATARWRRDLEARLDGDVAFASLIDEVLARRLDPASAARRLRAS
jgi:LAO/AO transport system kinase